MVNCEGIRSVSEGRAPNRLQSPRQDSRSRTVWRGATHMALLTERVGCDAAQRLSEDAPLAKIWFCWLHWQRAVNKAELPDP